MTEIGIILNGKVSAGVAKTEKEAKKYFKNYYGYSMPKDAYFSKVKMVIEHKDNQCSMYYEIVKEELGKK